MEVLDASVGLKWVLNETDVDKARALRDEFRASLRDFIAPMCLRRNAPTL
jgi:hypothetical protein